MENGVHSPDQRKRAVDLYIRYGFKATAAMRELGYPGRAQLASWHNERQENGGRLTDRSLGRYMLEQKGAAVRHCLTHGRCNAFARRELGYLKCTAKLAERTGEYAPSVDGRPGHVRFLNGVETEEGTVYNDSALENMQWVKIRETIRSHLEKEQALFRRGIKCLSLFFIDEVAKYRDVTGNGATVDYGKVLEEEYAAAVEDRLAHPTMDDLADLSYLEYLRRDTAHQVYDGCFSIDKKGNAVESMREKRAEAAEGLDINDDARRGYDLILKDKERLLSLDEPVRFVFSHSALREGWDNPNIFQIWTLKESGSEISKRQEVGRGLRLCVDQDGVRQDAQLLGADEVQRVNVLTVIASESYETFVRDLQSDIRSTLRERPQKVEIDFFSGKPLRWKARMSPSPIRTPSPSTSIS